MAEIENQEHIQQNNAELIQKASRKCFDNLVQAFKLESMNAIPKLESFQTQSAAFNLTDLQGNHLHCELSLVYIEFKNLENRDDFEQEWGVILNLSFPNNPKTKGLAESVTTTFDLLGFSNYDVGYRSLLFNQDNESPQSLHVTADMTVAKEYQQLGIGRALLISSEELKVKLASHLAKKTNATTLITHLSDASEEGWTEKQVSTILEGYVKTGDAFDKEEPIGNND